jgi:hypothetical protein
VTCIDKNFRPQKIWFIENPQGAKTAQSAEFSSPPTSSRMRSMSSASSLALRKKKFPISAGKSNISRSADTNPPTQCAVGV